MKFLRRRPTGADDFRVHYEHPAQLLAATFLRAAATGDLALLWERLSRESRGLLEGRYAARIGVGLARAAGVSSGTGDARVAGVAAPLRASILRSLGGEAAVNAMGVSATRLLSRTGAFVLLLPHFGDERIVAAEDWRPAHLLGFVLENREWLVDLGLTAALSAEAGLPDPLGDLR